MRPAAQADRRALALSLGPDGRVKATRSTPRPQRHFEDAVGTFAKAVRRARLLALDADLRLLLFQLTRRQQLAVILNLLRHENGFVELVEGANAVEL